jgi:hypothetical protein
MAKFNYYFSLLLFLSSYSFAQRRIGQWTDYLPYNAATSVTKGNGKVYAATGNSVFSISWEDNSFERINKINGLSDVGAKLVRLNPYNNTLLIVYSNSNIDVIKNGTIINFSDIKRKNITSDKTVYHVSFHNEMAYIATGFGVVVFDTDQLEFKDTYVIGNNGTYLTVYDVATDGNLIFAATENGLKKSSLSSNLSDFQNWSFVTDLPAKPFNCVANFNNEFIANYSSTLDNGINYRDTLYVFNGVNWDTLSKPSIGPGLTYQIKRILPDEQEQHVYITDQWGMDIYLKNPGWSRVNALGGGVNFTDNYNQVIWPQYTEGISTFGFGSGTFCLGSQNCGIVKISPSGIDRLVFNGPEKKLVSQMKLLNEKLLVAPVYLTEIWYNQFLKTGVYTLKNGTWKTINKDPLNDSINDINCVTYFNNDEQHYFAGTWGNGLLEFRGDTLYTIYNNTNSSLKPATTTTNSVRVNGMANDSIGNLWVSNAFTTYVLSVLKPDGSWTAFNFGSLIPNNSLAGKVLIDKNNQKWIQLPGVGFLVYDDKGNYQQPITSGSNLNVRKITTSPGSGGLPSAQVFSMCEDREGDIWVGSDKGIAVFYNPESILTNSGEWDCQQIIIEQNGIAKILLETETVFDIVTDGANRKWIATKSGIFCLSSDGQKEYHHFTTDNSPLFSNEVIDLEYDGKTGLLYIGTTEGIQSYCTEVTDAFEDFTDVYAYPNPVRPGYEGPIVIKGMVADAVVKITDITGTLIYETTSQGGQAIWYGKNFKGERAASGVYVVFCASKDGEQKTLTKILLVN